MKILKPTLLWLLGLTAQKTLFAQAPALMMIKFNAAVPFSEIDSLKRAYGATQLDSTVTTNVRLWSIPNPTQYGGLAGTMTRIETSYNAQGNVKASTDSLASIRPNIISPGVQSCFNPQFRPDCILNPSHPVRIAVLDTGIDSTVAVQNPLLNRFFNKNMSRNFSTIGNSPADSLDVKDINGHGTAIAHIIAQMWDKTGMFGRNRGQEIIMLRIFDGNNHASQWAIVKALDFVLQEKIAVVNMSINWRVKKHDIPNNPTILKRIFTQLTDSSILVIASAGNDHKNIDSNTDSIAYMPGNLGYNGLTNGVPLSLLTVAATTCKDSLASFSNWGAPSVAVAALGVNIPALDHRGNLNFLSGSSMSAAIVSGLVATRAAHYSYRLNNTDSRSLLRLSCGEDRPALLGMTQFGRTLLSDQKEVNPIATGLKIVPNPAISNIQIKFELNSEKTVQLFLQDMLGRTILTKSVQANSGENSVEWQLPPTLTSGLYLLTLRSNLFSTTQKIQIQ